MNNKETMENDEENRQEETPSRRRAAQSNQERQGRSHYIQLAAELAGSLPVLQAQPANNEGVREQQEAVGNEERIRNASENPRQAVSSRQREATESIAVQESLSDYNPDASCGDGPSCHVSEEESLVDSSLQFGRNSVASEGFVSDRREGEMEVCSSSCQASICADSSLETESSSSQSTTDSSVEGTESYSRKFQEQESLTKELSGQRDSSRGRERERRNQGRSHYLQIAADMASSLSELQAPKTRNAEAHERQEAEPSSQMETNSCEFATDSFVEGSTICSSEFQEQQESLTEDLKLRNTNENASNSVVKQEREGDYYGEPSTKKLKPNPEVSCQEVSLSADVSLPGDVSLPVESVAAEPEASITTCKSGIEFKQRQEVMSVDSEQCESVPNQSRNTENLHRAGSSISPTESNLGVEFQSLNLTESSDTGSSNISGHSMENSNANSSQEVGSFQSESGQDSFSKDSSLRTEHDHSVDRTCQNPTAIRTGNVSSSPDVENPLPGNSMQETGDVRPRSPVTEPVVGPSQGARPKTAQQGSKRPIPKSRKKKNKGSYAQLSEDIAGDFGAMNKQLENSRAARNRVQSRYEEEVQSRRGQSGDMRMRENGNRHGVSVLTTEASNATTRQQRDQEQRRNRRRSPEGEEQRSADLQRRENGNRHGATVSATEASNATTRQQREQEQREEPDGEELRSADVRRRENGGRHEAAVAATETSNATTRQQWDQEQRQRSQQSAQSLADSMAPQLQALVIEMIQQDDEEHGGHIFNGIRLNQPDPRGAQTVRARRGVPQELGGNADEGSCAAGASQQPRGKKKGPKKKGHYVELAGLIAPQLAAVNKKIVNQQQGREEQQQGSEGTEDSHANGGVQQMVANNGASVPREGFPREAWPRARGASRDTASLSNQSEATDGRVPRDGLSLPLNLRTAPQGRERRNGQHGSRNRDGKFNGATGQENRPKTGKQKKKPKDQDIKNNCSQLAENLAAPLAALNAQLEERQRQHREAHARQVAMDVDVSAPPSQSSLGATLSSVTEVVSEDSGLGVIGSVTGNESDPTLSRSASEHDDSSLTES